MSYKYSNCSDRSLFSWGANFVYWLLELLAHIIILMTNGLMLVLSQFDCHLIDYCPSQKQKNHLNEMGFVWAFKLICWIVDFISYRISNDWHLSFEKIHPAHQKPLFNPFEKLDFWSIKPGGSLKTQKELHTKKKKQFGNSKWAIFCEELKQDGTSIALEIEKIVYYIQYDGVIGELKWNAIIFPPKKKKKTKIKNTFALFVRWFDSFNFR